MDARRSKLKSVTIQSACTRCSVASHGEQTMRLICFLVLMSIGACFSTASAQLINQGVTNQNFGGSFFESSGIGWHLNGPGFAANSGFAGQPGGVVPPFGNFNPNSGLQTGVGIRGGGFAGGLTGGFSQGSIRSNVSTSASVTTMDGMPGFISSQTVRPFVTGITPVVGGQVFGGQVIGGQRFLSTMPPLPPSPAQAFGAYRQSQMAELQHRQSVQNDAVQKKAEQAFDRGMRAEEEGNLRMARANYRNALQTAMGSLRIQVLNRVRARGW